MVQAADRFLRRRRRVRYALKENGKGRLRLSVFRSGRHIYGQVIDAARQVGLLLASRAKEAGIEAVMFDRGGYKYHGRVKALAEGAREGGLQF